MRNYIFILFLTLTTLCSCVQSDERWSDASLWYKESNVVTDTGFVDVFYLVSTNVSASHNSDGEESFNAIMDSAAVASYSREMAFVRANLFPDSLNFYAPFYRQATMNALMLPKGIGEEFYNIACHDVFDAFDYYMRHYNNGKRFVIAGFSQGARITVDLLKHMNDEQFSRLVAAYVIGYGIDSADISNPHVIPAYGRDERGVCISYNSVRDTFSIWDVVYNNAQACINPVNWRTDSTPATFQYDGETLTVSVDTVRHLLLVPDCQPSQRNTLWPEGALHVQDLLFYAPFLRRNIIDRSY